MADIFLSYAREDEEHAKRLAEAFAGRGWTVFWDRTIPPGKTWRQYIGKELDDAGCVVVLWSRHSVASNWVTEEADRALERDVLAPALIDAVRPPLGYGQIQAADLLPWKTRGDESALDGLCAVIETRITAAARTPSTAEGTGGGGVRPPETARHHEPGMVAISWSPYALASVLAVTAAWVIAGPSIHHDMPELNTFLIVVVTLGAFMAFPIAPSGAALAAFGLQGLNLFAMWTTMTLTTNVMSDPTGIVFLIGIGLANSVLVGVVCRWRIAGRRGAAADHRADPAAALRNATAGLLLLLWVSYAATALVAKYAWVLRESRRGLGSIPEAMTVVGILWLAVTVAGIAVGWRARKAKMPQGQAFAWLFAPLNTLLYVSYSVALWNQLGTANGAYSVLIETTNWGAFLVPLASAFGLWLYASPMSARDERTAS